LETKRSMWSIAISTAPLRKPCFTGMMSIASKWEVNGRPWSFDGDGALLRLVTEARVT
jgi:hypothetical protein